MRTKRAKRLAWNAGYEGDILARGLALFELRPEQSGGLQTLCKDKQS